MCAWSRAYGVVRLRRRAPTARTECVMTITYKRSFSQVGFDAPTRPTDDPLRPPQSQESIVLQRTDTAVHRTPHTPSHRPYTRLRPFTVQNMFFPTSFLSTSDKFKHFKRAESRNFLQPCKRPCNGRSFMNRSVPTNCRLLWLRLRVIEADVTDRLVVSGRRAGRRLRSCIPRLARLSTGNGLARQREGRELRHNLP